MTDVMYCAMQKNPVVVTRLLQTCNMSFPFLQQLLLKRIFNVVYLWKIFNFPYIFYISSFPKNTTLAFRVLIYLTFNVGFPGTVACSLCCLAAELNPLVFNLSTDLKNAPTQTLLMLL